MPSQEIQKKKEIMVRYKINATGELKYSFIVDNSYENALRKFLKIKGGKETITILSIRDWDRKEMKFTIPEPICLKDKNSIVYKIMNE